MNITNIKKRLIHLRHQYGSMNNIVISVGLLVAAVWVWGSINTMQRNFALQKQYDAQQRELQVTELELQTLQYQKNYYQSDEYKDLAAREHLGLAGPGEKVLLLPPNSAAVRQESASAANQQQPLHKQAPGLAQSNLVQWVNFLVGNSAKYLQN